MFIPISHLFFAFLATSLSFGAMGYYLSHRGWVGVKLDLENIAQDVQTIKAKVKAKL